MAAEHEREYPRAERQYEISHSLVAACFRSDRHFQLGAKRSRTSRLDQRRQLETCCHFAFNQRGASWETTRYSWRASLV
jgi:hypothetical protein